MPDTWSKCSSVTVGQGHGQHLQPSLLNPAASNRLHLPKFPEVQLEKQNQPKTTRLLTMHPRTSRNRCAMHTNLHLAEGQRCGPAAKKTRTEGCSGLPRVVLETPKHWVINSELSHSMNPLVCNVPNPNPCRSLESESEPDKKATTHRGASEMPPLGPPSVKGPLTRVQGSTKSCGWFINTFKSIGSRIRMLEGRALLFIISSIAILGVVPGAGSVENASHPYGEIGYGYWAQGVTNYPWWVTFTCLLLDKVEPNSLGYLGIAGKVKKSPQTLWPVSHSSKGQVAPGGCCCKCGKRMK